LPIGNILAKNYQNQLTYIKVIACRRSVVFWEHGVSSYCNNDNAIFAQKQCMVI